MKNIINVLFPLINVLHFGDVSVYFALKWVKPSIAPRTNRLDDVVYFVNDIFSVSCILHNNKINNAWDSQSKTLKLSKDEFPIKPFIKHIYVRFRLLLF
jgi:hypothetical protein